MRITTKNPKCRQCGIKLSLDNCKSYRLNKSDYICNTCYNVIANKYQKEWAKKNKDKVNAKERKYRQKHPEKILKWYRARVCREYGLTTEDFDNKYNEQHGCCPICGRHSLELQRKLDIDHNHVTNQNRGLLCSRCNIGNGYFKVDERGIELLQKAIEYIKKYDLLKV